MKTLCVKKCQIAGKGRFGLYFKISRSQGVKITGRGFKNKSFISSHLKTNKGLQNTLKEASIGLLACSATQGVVVVRFSNKYYLGILQAHLEEGKKISNIDKRIERDFKVCKKVKEDLKKRQVIHGDLHSGNVRWLKNKPYALDFDPEYAFYVGEKRKYYIIKNRLIKGLKNS